MYFSFSINNKVFLSNDLIVYTIYTFSLKFSIHDMIIYRNILFVLPSWKIYLSSLSPINIPKLVNSFKWLCSATGIIFQRNTVTLKETVKMKEADWRLPRIFIITKKRLIFFLIPLRIILSIWIEFKNVFQRYIGRNDLCLNLFFCCLSDLIWILLSN